MEKNTTTEYVTFSKRTATNHDYFLNPVRVQISRKISHPVCIGKYSMHETHLLDWCVKLSVKNYSGAQ